MKKQLGKVHTIAQCEDCEWRSEDYKNGQAIAAKHAKHHKHKVNIDIGLGGYYDGRVAQNK